MSHMENQSDQYWHFMQYLIINLTDFGTVRVNTTILKILPKFSMIQQN